MNSSSRPLSGHDRDDFMTVPEAAHFLRISEPTVWRWLRAGKLHGFRRGGRRVWLRRSDLRALETPLERRQSEPDRPAWLVLTGDEQREALAAIESLRQIHAQQMATRGGKLYPPAADDLREARAARSTERG